MCFNVFIICNHEKGTSMEIRSCREGRGVGVATGEREKKKVCVCVSLCPR